MMILYQDFLKIQVSSIGNSNSAYGDIYVAALVNRGSDFSCHISLNSRNGKYDHENDEKEEQCEQGSTKYFPEFFDRYLCFNFANNINDF